MNNIAYKDNFLDEKSKNIGFKITQYPDGQRNVILDLEKLDKKQKVYIKCRIRSFSYFEILFCLIAALEREDFYIETIDFVYLTGLRSDRSFVKGDCNYLMNIIRPFILRISSKVKNIRIFEPHKEEFLGMNNCQIDIYTNYFEMQKNTSFVLNYNHLTEISGDKSYRPYHGYHFDKIRENKSIKVELPKKIIEHLYNTTKDILICDDLCDGGATFIAEAKYLKNHFPNRKLYLCVIHGLFTNGADLLLEHFDRIFCTNSYRDICHDKITQLKVI